jgi:hypothetical protein
VHKRVGTRRARITIVVLALGIFGIFAHVAGATSSPDHEITICHATGSYSNPYVVITVDVASTQLAGHVGHDGPVFFTAIAKHTDWGDIIPPTSNGGTIAVTPKNWSAQGQSIWANGCGATGPVTTTAVGVTTTTGGPATTTTNEATTTTTAEPETTTTGPGEPTTTTSVPDAGGSTTTTELATTTTVGDS